MSEQSRCSGRIRLRTSIIQELASIAQFIGEIMSYVLKHKVALRTFQPIRAPSLSELNKSAYR